MKSTRFADGTHQHDGARGGGLSKPVMARDTTLGTEYVEQGQQFNLDGFSWQDPFRSGASRTPSGSYPPPEYYDGRLGSGSHPMQGSSPYRFSSNGSMAPPPCPPPGQYQTYVRSGEERHFRYTASGRYESWGAGMPPPPMPGFSHPPDRTGTFGRDRSGREHSLGQNFLPHASIRHAAPSYAEAFDHSRGQSGQWSHPPPPHGPYPPPMTGAPPFYYSNGQPIPANVYPQVERAYSAGHPAPGPAPLHHSPVPPSHTVPTKHPTSPRYDIDPAVASTWSNQKPATDLNKTWSGSSGEEADRFGTVIPPRKSAINPTSVDPTNPTNNDLLVRPDVVKRATSNQNETPETKHNLHGPSVKRAVLSRDRSAVSSRLKQQYLPEYNDNKGPARPQPIDHEMRMLSNSLEISTLEDNPGDSSSSVPAGTVKPAFLSEADRTSTLDQIAMDLMVRPPAALNSVRSSTIDALNLDFDDSDSLFNSNSMIASPDSTSKAISKPPVVTMGARLSTNDVLEIVNQPIPDDDMELVSGGKPHAV